MLDLVEDIATMVNRFDTFYAEFLELNHDVLLFWEQTEPEGGFVLSDDGEPSVLHFTPTLCFPDLDTASILFMYCMWTFVQSDELYIDRYQGRHNLAFGRA